MRLTQSLWFLPWLEQWFLQGTICSLWCCPCPPWFVFVFTFRIKQLFVVLLISFTFPKFMWGLVYLDKVLKWMVAKSWYVESSRTNHFQQLEIMSPLSITKCHKYNFSFWSISNADHIQYNVNSISRSANLNFLRSTDTPLEMRCPYLIRL